MERARRFSSSVRASPAWTLAAAAQAVEGGVQRLVAGRAELPEAAELGLADLVAADGEDGDVLAALGAEAVHADDGLGAGVDARLGAGRGLLDAELGQPLLDGAGHAAELLDLGHVRAGARGELLGERLDVVAAAPGVDGPRDPALLLQHELRARAMRAEKSVGSASASSRELVWRLWCRRSWPQGLDGRAGHVVVDVLGAATSRSSGSGCAGRGTWGSSRRSARRPRPTGCARREASRPP